MQDVSGQSIVSTEIEALGAHRFRTEEMRYGPRDVMLYALGINAALDPGAPGALDYVFEQGLQVPPTFALVLGTQDSWYAAPGYAIDPARVLHVGQHLTLHRPLPPEGRVLVRYKVRGVSARGGVSGVTLAYDKQIADAVTGDVLAEMTFTLLCQQASVRLRQGDLPSAPAAPPAREADLWMSQATDPRAALIYRLSGDLNPLHVNPAAAKRAGFDRPVLHGLCTLGTVAQALTGAGVSQPGTRLCALSARFNGPVWPGEELQTQIWRQPGGALFRVTVPARKAVVIGRAEAQFTQV